MRNNTLLPILAALFWLGCSRIPDVPATQNRRIPLEPGMWWEYAETVQTYNGSSLLYEKIQPLRMEVTQGGYLNSPHPGLEDAPYAHVEVFEVRLSIPGNQTLLYLHPDSTGIYLYGRRTQVAKDAELGIEYGCEFGNLGGSNRDLLAPAIDWTPAQADLAPMFLFGCVTDSAYAASLSAALQHGRTFASTTSETVQTPAGTFATLNAGDEEWWAHDIGLVKAHLDFVTGQGSWQRRYVISRALTGYGE